MKKKHRLLLLEAEVEKLKRAIELIQQQQQDPAPAPFWQVNPTPLPNNTVCTDYTDGTYTGIRTCH